MIYVFDLDDTLYYEQTYVDSGFCAVDKFLETNFGIKNSYTKMKEILQEQGRGKVFDTILREYNIYSKSNVKRCLSTYRLHKPKISLADDAKILLEKLKNEKKYIITDGNKIVQNLKIEALGLREIMQKCYITHRYGKKHAKPAPYCFELIRKRENVTAQEIIYIGDNPRKDFVEIKKLGYRTARIYRGMFVDLNLDKEFEAEFKLKTLLDLLEIGV